MKNYSSGHKRRKNMKLLSLIFWQNNKLFLLKILDTPVCRTEIQLRIYNIYFYYRSSSPCHQTTKEYHFALGIEQIMIFFIYNKKIADANSKYYAQCKVIP